MRSGACASLLVIFSCVCTQRAVSDSLTSGARYAAIDDDRHMFKARGSSSVQWSPQLTADFMVLQYDRKNGAVVGYQRSTGKVFGQRSLSGLDKNHNLQLDHGVLLSLEHHQAFKLDHSRPCAVLTLAPHIEVSDIEWHPFEEMHEMRCHQT
jgi:hypothetical protein